MLLKAFRHLLLWDLEARLRGFPDLYRAIKNYPVSVAHPTEEDIDRVVRSLGTASIWYFKRVLCLQRSCCLVRMLRDIGVNAKLTIGSQQWPPRTHAWVTIDGQVVGDSLNRIRVFSVLDAL